MKQSGEWHMQTENILDIIFKQSEIQYISDMVLSENHSVIYEVILALQEDKFSAKQWEEAYHYITGLDDYKGGGKKELISKITY